MFFALSGARRLGALSFVFVLSMVSRSGFAQSDPDAQARAHFEAGSSYYASGEFERAAAEFERAHALSGRIELLHNLYLAHRDAGNLEGAADALRGFLEGSPDLPGDQRTILEGRLGALERRIAEDEAEEAVAAAPPTPPAAQPAAQPVASLTEEDEGGMGLAPGAIVLGAGGAALAVSLVQGARARSTSDEYDEVCALSGIPGECLLADDARLRELEGDFARQRSSAWGLLAAGAVTVSVGTVLMILGAGDGDEDGVTVDVACRGFGCGVVAKGTF